MTGVLVSCIRMYQRWISSRLGRNKCRFHPTCSQYAVIAIQKYGCRLGIVMAWKRLLRCRPDNRESCIDFP